MSISITSRPSSSSRSTITSIIHAIMGDDDDPRIDSSQLSQLSHPLVSLDENSERFAVRESASTTTSGNAAAAAIVDGSRDWDAITMVGEDKVLGQLRSLGRFRWRRYSRWEKILFGLTLLQVVAFLFIRALVYFYGKQEQFVSITGRNSKGADYDAFMLAIMVNNSLWQIFFFVGGLMFQNHFDILAYYFAVILLAIHAIYEATRSSAPLPIASSVILCLFALVMLPLTLRVYRDIQSVRQFALFQKVSRIRQILEIHKKYLFVVTAFKLDAYLATSLLISGYFGHIWSSNGYAQWLAPVGYCVTLISFAFGVVGMRLERRSLIFIFVLLAAIEPFAIIYKMAEWEADTHTFDETQQVLSKLYFFFLGALAMLARVMAIVVVARFTRYFGRGLREHVFVRRMPGSVTSSHELST